MSVVVTPETHAEFVRKALEIPDDVHLRQIVVAQSYGNLLDSRSPREGASVRIEMYEADGRPPIEIVGWAMQAQADAIAYALNAALGCGITWLAWNGRPG